MSFLLRLVSRSLGVVRRLRTAWQCERLSWYIDQSPQRWGIRVLDPRIRLNIVKGRGARIELHESLRVAGWQGRTDPVSILLGDGATLRIRGRFTIGPGVSISVSNGGILDIGGASQESDSGITANANVMVRRSMVIGTDLICAWNTFLTDCDWHSVGSRPCQADVVIGDHVWLTPNAQVLKGSIIGANCIVGNGVVVHKQAIPSSTILTPAKPDSRALAATWTRDMVEKPSAPQETSP